MKTKNWLDEHFEELLLTICLLLILAVSFVQVIIRKIPGLNALTWAEEFCRFMWIFSVFLSLPYCIRRGSMLRVEVLRNALGDKGQRVFDFAANILILVSMLGLAVISFGVVKSRFESAELSPAMLTPMWIIYSVMLLGYALGAFRAVQVLVQGERKRRNG